MRKKRVLVWKSEGRRQLRRTRGKRETNIEMVCKEIGWDGVDGIHLAQDGEKWRAVMRWVMNLRVP